MPIPVSGAVGHLVGSTLNTGDPYEDYLRRHPELQQPAAAPMPAAPAPMAAAQTIAQGIGGMGGGSPQAAPSTGPQVGADPAISMQGLNSAVGGGGDIGTPSVINAPGGLRQNIGARIYPDGSKKLRTGAY